MTITLTLLPWMYVPLGEFVFVLLVLFWLIRDGGTLDDVFALFVISFVWIFSTVTAGLLAQP